METWKEIAARIPREAEERINQPRRDPGPDPWDDFDPTEVSDTGWQGCQSQASVARFPTTRSRNSEVPKVYVPKGINFARFYRDSAGQYLRTLYVHKYRAYLVPCHDPLDCEICARLQTVPSDWRQKWDYRLRELSLSYAWLQSPRPRPAYVKLRQPVLT